MSKNNIENNRSTHEEIKNLNTILAEVSEMIQMYNHFLDFVPSRSDIKEDNLPHRYDRVYDALADMFCTNQQLIKKLNEVSLYFYDLEDEMKVK